MHTLPSVKDTIHLYELDARKGLGQHFLLDENITRKIVQLSGEVAGLNLIEIGPGPGGLTRALVQSGAQAVYAVEKDNRCKPVMQALQAVSPLPFTLLEGDALRLNLLEAVPAPRAIIANLPYNVGTEMLVQWLQQIAEDADSYRFLTLMFQKEVAQRLYAEPGSKRYGRLSVLAQWLCEVTPLFDLPPGAFSPPPKVDSSVVQLVPRKTPEPVSIKALTQLTGAAFGQRRKMLRASLKGLIDDPIAFLETEGIDPTLRAENLTVSQFLALAGRL